MARKKNVASEARALVDINLEGVTVPSGKTFAADPEIIDALVQSGHADSNPDAVAAGKDSE